MSLLSIENLSIRFGATPVVTDVSLTVNAGEILALVGESGSGKTLTAQSVLQLLPPEAVIRGSIRFQETTLLTQDDSGETSARSLRAQNRSVAALHEDSSTVTTTRLAAPSIRSIRGKHIGMIFQEPMSALNPLHTIDRQILEGYCLHSGAHRRSPQAKRKLAELLDAVGLAHLGDAKRYPHQLSGGERQRAMIAMAIANDPALLIADEPTTALDVTLQHQILELLKTLQRERGMGMLFISHDLVAVRRFADRVAVMQQGRVVETGTTEQIFTAPREAYTQTLIHAAPKGTAAPLMPNAPVVLHTEKLRVSFPILSPILRRKTGEVNAAQNISISLRAGETLGIVGESGSGKSSLANAILRLVKSDGPIVFLGQRLDQLQGKPLRLARRDFQPVFQDPYGSLNPRMTVAELVAEGLWLHYKEGLAPPSPAKAGLPLPLRGSPSATQDSSNAVDSAVDAMLARVGLSPDAKHRYPHAFSGGQRQRIAIARAMILKPKLVVLDEPTSALDLSVQATVLELLKDLQATEQTSYLFISHDLRVIRSVAHQVLVMKRGAVVEHGETQALFTAPQQDYTKALIAAALGA